MRRPRILDPGGDHVRPADQDGVRQVLVPHHLRRPQDAVVLAFGIDDPGPCRLDGSGEDRLHHRARGVDVALQRAAIGLDVGDRPGGDAGIHGGLGHRRCHLGDDAGIERARDQVLGPETDLLLAVGRGHHVRLLGPGELGQRPHAGELHLLVDRGGADVEGTAEDEREAEDVVDLVRVVGAAGGDDGVGPHRLAPAPA